MKPGLAPVFLLEGLKTHGQQNPSFSAVAAAAQQEYARKREPQRRPAAAHGAPGELLHADTGRARTGRGCARARCGQAVGPARERVMMMCLPQ